MKSKSFAMEVQMSGGQELVGQMVFDSDVTIWCVQYSACVDCSSGAGIIRQPFQAALLTFAYITGQDASELEDIAYVSGPQPTAGGLTSNPGYLFSQILKAPIGVSGGAANSQGNVRPHLAVTAGSALVLTMGYTGSGLADCEVQGVVFYE